MIRFLQTPTPMKRFVLGAILVVFCLIMVISLVPNLNQSLLGNPTNPSVLAKVGDQDVSMEEVQQRASSVAQSQGYPAQLIPLLLPQALNAVIADKAVISEAHRMGLKVTNDEVVDLLRHGALGNELFPNGQFIGDDKYDQFVADNFRMSKAQFEDMIRSVLLTGKLRSMIEQGATVSDDEVRKAFAEQNVKVKLEYAVLALEDVQSQVKVTEPEVKAYFEAHKSVYQAGNSEKRKITY